MSLRGPLVILALTTGAASLTSCADPVADLEAEVGACDTSLTVPDDVSEADARCALDCLAAHGCADLEDRDESCVADCDVDLWGDEDDPPTTSFGEDGGALSISAPELFSKPAGNPDPETLVGIFEVTGYGSEDHPEDFLIASNTWKIRREHRETGIAMAAECLIDVGGAQTATQTLYAFASSPIQVEDWGIRVLEASSDDVVYDQLGFEIHCAVDIPALDMPFCLESGVPDGYSLCVEVVDGKLTFRSVDGSVTDGGKKISD